MPLNFLYWFKLFHLIKLKILLNPMVNSLNLIVFAAGTAIANELLILTKIPSITEGNNSNKKKADKKFKIGSVF